MSPDADDVAADPDIERLKAALGHLAGSGDRTVIDRAEAAIDDLEAAAAFVDEVGLDELERAIEATEAPELHAPASARCRRSDASGPPRPATRPSITSTAVTTPI